MLVREQTRWSRNISIITQMRELRSTSALHDTCWMRLQLIKGKGFYQLLYLAFALVGNNWIYESTVSTGSQSVKCPEITLNFWIELWNLFLSWSRDKEEPLEVKFCDWCRNIGTKKVLAYHERKYEVHRRSDAVIVLPEGVSKESLAVS